MKGMVVIIMISDIDDVGANILSAIQSKTQLWLLLKLGLAYRCHELSANESLLTDSRIPYHYFYPR